MLKAKTEYRALGLMSGTSLDGLDMAICNFQIKRGIWKHNLEKAQTIKYPKELHDSLKNAYYSSAKEIAGLDSKLGKFIGEASSKFLKKAKLKVNLIASHGHTVFHEPENGYTFQIGNGAEIAAETGIQTICDFRSVDVAKGGQGAPLVPIGDKFLFPEFDACLNLGGFANISFDNEYGRRIAFDICAVNFVLNRLSNKLGMDFDNKGKIASSGIIISELFKELNKLEFYQQKLPKSLGQEWVEKNVQPLLSKKYKSEDLLRTFTEHVAIQISKVLNDIKGNRILVTGGGVYNNYLIQLLSLKCKKEIVVPTKLLIDFKEALIFAFLGVLRLRGEVNSLATVTGASSDSINGCIYFP